LADEGIKYNHRAEINLPSYNTKTFTIPYYPEFWDLFVLNGIKMHFSLWGK
jgi:hypothetical protein